jgi:hypothetical protein
MTTSKIAQIRPHSAERGQDAVEFALIFPILFLIFVVIFDLGRVTYYRAVLHNAAREGARFGSIDPEDTDGIITAVERLAVGIEPEDLDIDITDDPEAKIIEVVVSYEMAFVTPIVRAVLGGQEFALLQSSSTLGYEQ